MSSFSCPHLNTETTYCNKLNVDCIPGRKGCVLAGKYQFAVPAEERIKKNEFSKKDKPKKR
ncbi:MAG: hypothetical protein HXY50_08235 [Ignavibacteriaceae bacterium]|nr:hypothetical protein [Ignavibacteriaceae bacterium]